MAKIIEVRGTRVTVGFGDGSMKELPLSVFDFSPAIGQEVEVYASDDKILVIPKEGQNNGLIWETRDGIWINRILYALLAIFLGGIGVHKFVARKYFMGVVYLLFCWTGIPALVGFIEGIMAFGGKTDSFGRIWFPKKKQ